MGVLQLCLRQNPAVAEISEPRAMTPDFNSKLPCAYRDCLVVETEDSPFVVGSGDLYYCCKECQILDYDANQDQPVQRSRDYYTDGDSDRVKMSINMRDEYGNDNENYDGESDKDHVHELYVPEDAPRDI